MSPIKARRRRAATVAALSAAAALTFAAGASASLGQLPPGAQVNDDPANNIFPDQPAGVSDVVGGSLAAGGVNVPWATFEQKTGASQQIFVRAFKGGKWTTQGFPASLNIDTNQVAEAPSIDFAGAGRTVPWVSWYEPNVHLGGVKNIFASRFDSTAKVWIPEGQERSAGNFKVPSVNIHTNREAENPSLAGGAAVAGNAPVPWIAWQEVDGVADKDQIFVSRGVKDPTCGSLQQFCWQPTGIKRLASGQNSEDPSLNIDVKRDGIEPDIAFTGKNDTTPWVVWYEKGDGTPGLRGTEQVFAARAAAPAATDDASVGGFKWVAVGNGTAAKTETLGKTVNDCASSQDAEDACSLNLVPGHDAEDPRIAAGSLVPGGTAAPWVVWTEDTGSGTHAIFISRLVGGNHFELFNNGQPISNTVNDSTRPDITFVGNEPYVSWTENVNGKLRTFSGHFEGGAAAPVFKLDTPGGLPQDVVEDLRSPISSGCTANPFTADGVSCPGAAAGTPFLLQTLTDGKLLGQGYQAVSATTGAASAIAETTAHVDSTVDGGGAPVNAHIEFGPSAAYGLRTDDVKVLPGAGLGADLTGLPAGTLIHYRAVASSDFGTVVGADRTLVTTAAPVVVQPSGPGPVTSTKRFAISGRKLKLSRKAVVKVVLSCPPGKTCKGTVKLRAGKLVLGSARYSIKSGATKTISVHLNRKGAKRVRRAHSLKVRVSAGGHSRTVTLKS